MIKFSYKGDYGRTTRYLNRMKNLQLSSILSRYANRGVSVLATATPVESGVTANSWGYTIEKSKDGFSIIWTNANTPDGVPLVLMLQYGHSTGTGGWVRGRDFINPVMQPLFDELTNELWKEVTSL